MSLEDELFKQYNIGKRILSLLGSEAGETEADNPVLRREILHAQKVIEGQNTAIRSTLNKYNQLVEQQRSIIFRRRLEVLKDEAELGLISGRLGERYRELCDSVGEAAVKKAEKQMTLYFINSCWADYLDYISYIKESIHLMHLSGRNPVHEFNRIAVEAFEEMQVDIDDQVS